MSFTKCSFRKKKIFPTQNKYTLLLLISDNMPTSSPSFVVIFVLVISIVIIGSTSSSPNNIIGVSAQSGRLSNSHSISMEEHLEARQSHLSNRRQRVNTQRQQEEEQRRQVVVDQNNNDDDIQVPQVVGRGRGRKSYRRHLDESHKKRTDTLQQLGKKVNPMMTHMSTEQRAAHLLFSQIESKFLSQSGQARQLLQMLQDAKPSHHIARKWGDTDDGEEKQKHPEQAAKELAEKEHYEKVRSLETIINRLDYQLNDIKSFAEEVAKDSAESRASHKGLTTGFEQQLEQERTKCAEMIAKQEEKVIAADLALNERTKELTAIKNTMDSLGGGRDGSSSAEWKLVLIQNAEIIVGVTVFVYLFSVIVMYILGKRSGRKQGLTMKRGGDDYLFDGRAAVNDNNNNNTNTVSSPPPSQQHQHQYQQAPNRTIPSFQPQQHQTAPQPPQQQQQQQVSSPSGELRNRALHRFDGGV